MDRRTGWIHRIGAIAVGGTALVLALSGCGLLAGNRPPVAVAEASPTEGDAPLTVQFDGTRSFDEDDLIASYEWSFGDGTSASGATVERSFAKEGLYRVRLTVTDQFGARDTDTVEITVGNPPPQAVLTASSTSGWAPLGVAFDASASFDPADDPIVDYEWTFGDGIEADGVRVRHRYEQPGHYATTLRVTDDGGASSEATVDVYALDFATLDLADVEPGSSPTDLLAEDFDGDGELDVAVAASESNEVRLLFGQATTDGFAEGIRLRAGRRPVALASADINRDGRPDLAAANLDSGDVSVYLNRGGRQFDVLPRIRIGRWAATLEFGQFTDDDVPDLVVSDPETHRILVLRGDGDGGFTESATVENTIRWPSSFVVRDFNGDGQDDLAVAGFLANMVAVLAGDGAGGVSASTTYDVGAGPLSLHAGDLNDDNIPDLVTANSKEGTFSILIGDQRGRFDVMRTVSAGGGVRSLIVADVDGDGVPDLASANSRDATITVHLNGGSGNFSPDGMRLFPVTDEPTALVAADFDDSGFMDVLAIHFEAEQLTLLSNRL